MSRVEPNRNVYVGHRYVPKIFGEWDKKNEYEGLSIVTHQGASYTSKKRVPVGIDILNEEFWVITGNYDAQVDYYRDEVKRVKGNIERLDKDIKEYNSVSKDIYITAGTFSGDGSEEKPFSHINQAFDYLNSLSDKGAEGEWTLHLKGDFIGGSKIEQFPRLRETLNIVGEVDSLGEPLTTISMEHKGRNIGLWFQPSETQNVKIKNIMFKDFKVGLNGYGVLMKDGGKLFIENCVAENCDIGFASVNTGIFTIIHSKANNCRNGIVSQYNGVLTVGGTTNPEYVKNVITNCGYGVNITRGSQGHIDYNDISHCDYAGILIDTNSRANVTGCDISDNTVGVLLQGGSEWIDNNNTFNNNVTPWSHMGGSRETRMHAQTTITDQSYPPFSPSSAFTSTGTGEREIINILPSTQRIEYGQLVGDSKKIKIHMVGVIEKNNDVTGTLEIVGVGEESGLSFPLGSIEIPSGFSFNSFEYDFELMNTKRMNKVTFNNIPPAITSGVFTSKPNESLRLRTTLTTNGQIKLTTNYIVLTIAG